MCRQRQCLRRRWPVNGVGQNLGVLFLLQRQSAGYGDHLALGNETGIPGEHLGEHQHLHTAQRVAELYESHTLPGAGLFHSNTGDTAA